MVESHLHEEVDRDCALFFLFLVAVAASGLQNCLSEAKSEHIFMNPASSCPIFAARAVCGRDLTHDLVRLFSVLSILSLL